MSELLDANIGVCTVRALQRRKISKVPVGHIRQKIVAAKLDPNSEPTSRDTHFDTLPSTSIFQSGLGEIIADSIQFNSILF